MAVIRPSWLGSLSSGQFGQVSDDIFFKSDWKSFDDGTWRNIDLILWYKACMGHYLWVVLSRFTCAMSWGGLPVVSQFVHRAVILTFVQKYLYLIVVVIKTLWHYLLCLSQERYLRLKKWYNWFITNAVKVCYQITRYYCKANKCIINVHQIHLW